MTTDAREPLFDPVSLGALRLPNRTIMAPMTRSRALPGAVPHASAPLYYAQRAGAGLIVSEGVCISPTAAGLPGLPGIWSETQIAAWQEVTAAVHAADGRIVAQLWHIGRAGLPDLLPDGRQPVAPSAVAIDGTTYLARAAVPFVEPRALERDEIAAIVRDYATAAENARRAGFDGVELHGANGYLIDQFLHASSNHRDDEYGGDVQGRTRFLAEVTEAVCAVWGPGRVGVRLSPTSKFQDMHDPDLGGLFAAALARLDSFPLAFVHLVEPGISGALSTGEDRAGQLDSAWAQPRTRHPLVATGDYDAARALATLRRGDADAIGFARLFLANPDLLERIVAGAPLNEPQRPTFYGGDDVGYLDYPSLEAERLLGELRQLVREKDTDVLPDVDPLGAETPLQRWPLAWAVDRLRAELLEPAGRPTD